MKVFYRIEHSITGLGPFRSLKEDEREMLSEYWDNIPNCEEKFPDPKNDNLLLEQKEKIRRDGASRFCFEKESDIYDYFSERLVLLLLKRSFIIKEYREGLDFDDFYYVTGSILIILKDN